MEYQTLAEIALDEQMEERTILGRRYIAAYRAWQEEYSRKPRGKLAKKLLDDIFIIEAEIDALTRKMGFPDLADLSKAGNIYSPAHIARHGHPKDRKPDNIQPLFVFQHAA